MNHQIKLGDSLKLIQQVEPESIDCVITSPPYWAKRVYNGAGELGSERTPEEYVKNLADFFDELRPCLKPEANVFINMGDTYFGSGSGANSQYDANEEGRRKAKALKETYYTTERLQHLKQDGKLYQNKQLLLIPARFAIEMQNRGWILREDIIWHKPNRIPSGVKDRTINTYEHIYHFVLNRKYYYDLDSIKVVGKNGGLKNPGDVWSINTQALRGPHTASFPEELVRRLMVCGSPSDGVVLDPFLGSGTTWVVSEELGRHCIGFECNAEYLHYAMQRFKTKYNPAPACLDS